MNVKALVLLTLLILAPIVLLVGVGWRLAQNERDMFAQRIRELLVVRLGDIDRSIATYFETLERDMHRLTSIDRYDQAELRALLRDEPQILQLFVIAPDDTLLHPDPSSPLNSTEQQFFSQTGQIIVDRDIQRAAESQTDNSPASNSFPQAKSALQSTPRGQLPTGGDLPSGWFTWYWGRGVHLIYWQQRPNGHYVGVTLERSRWMADLIAALPDTPSQLSEAQAALPQSLIQLTDSKAQTVYQWGSYIPSESAEPAVGIPLSQPVNSWRLSEFIPPERLTASSWRGTYFNLASGLLVAATGLLAVGIFFYREYARDMREAEQRVSFVNQVSHELRTPLTNIRMYADLLQHDVERLPLEEAEPLNKRLLVIHSEGQRLSRLIDNVLTFARQQKKSLRLNPQPGNIDELIQQLVERSQPSLETHEIAVELALNADRQVLVDADALEQMLCNLMTNVEKYAAAGKWLSISSHIEHDHTVLEVADHGPGIPLSQRQSVFQPFWRGSEDLKDAAGTGIGLTIARQLARLHGGDLSILDAEQGACFQVRLHTPAA